LRAEKLKEAHEYNHELGLALAREEAAHERLQRLMASLPAPHEGEAPALPLRLGTNGTLGADDHQWILCREGKAVSFVRSTKAVLARCIREKGIELSPEGKAALDALADDFSSWRADPARRGTPIAPEALMPLGPAKNGLPSASKKTGEITWTERLEPDCALGTDGMQWIVYRRGGGDRNIAWQGKRWKPVGYIHSSRAALLACIEAKGLKLSASGRAAIARQDARVYRWRRRP
jgi:hypothetical protein